MSRAGAVDVPKPPEVDGASGQMLDEGAKIGFVRRFLSRRVNVVSLAFLVAVIAAATLAPWIAPYDPTAQNLGNVLSSPSTTHLLGTDEIGRDVLSRLLFGARVSLIATLQATSIALLLGIPVGLIAGFVSGRTDKAIMLFNDGLMSLPGTILAIAIVAALGPGLTNAMIAVGVVFAPRVVRVVRGETLVVRAEAYVEASRTIGLPTQWILVRHVLPNIRSSVIVYTTLLAARAMLAEAGLSFLGLGAQYPDASWGTMLGRFFRFMESAPALVFFPGIAIASVVLVLNLIGDGLRDATGREMAL